MNYSIKSFFDKATFTLSYIVYDSISKDAILIDPVLNYDFFSAKISYESLDQISHFIIENKLILHYSFETHAHADHFSGAFELCQRFKSVKIGINKNIMKVQKLFGDLFNLKELKRDGSQFDLLLEDSQVVKAGTIALTVLFTPGHTPACAAYLVGDMLFSGDTLFMPDSGTGRCDFPGGSAAELYHSVHEKLYKTLRDEIRVFTGHDYSPGGRKMEFESTIGQNKRHNIHIGEETTEAEFIAFRNQRDATLKPPRLLLPSIQININAGELPPEEDNGSRYLKIPLSFVNYSRLKQASSSRT